MVLAGIVIGALALLVGALALIPLQKHFYDKRVAKYNEMQKCIAERPYLIRKNISEDWAIGFPYLLHKKDWNHEKGKPLASIDEIALAADNTTYEYAEIRKYTSKYVLLPKKGKSITDNLLLFNNGVLYDAPTYGISNIGSSGGKITLSVKRGTYFDFVNTCFGYGFEAAYETMNNLHKFALRRKYPIIDFKSRFSLIGIVTLTIIKNVGTKNAKKCYCLIHERGNDVSESRGLINAIPGATFQPSKSTADKELGLALSEEGLKHAVIREFLEEIFGVEEYSELTEPSQLENSLAWPVLNNNIYYLGCGLNPINTYLELLSCAVIDMETSEAKALFDISAKSHTNITAISKKVVGNFEGSIKLKPLTIDTLKFYENAHSSAPALSQICKLILEDYDNILSQFGIY